MKYAREVLTLLGALPDRPFRMVEIIRHVTRGRALDPREREAVRKAVKRVLDTMIESGSVRIDRAAACQGDFAEYVMSQKWDIDLKKVGQEVGQYARATAP